MKRKITVWIAGLLLLAGCASVSRPRAVVADGTIENPAFGVTGFSLQIPEGFEVYSPAAKNPAEYNELQRMAIRIYELNKKWHPRGNELFYESFLLMSDDACFLLITLKTSAVPSFSDSPFSDEAVSQWELMPLYNVTARHPFMLGESRCPAVHTRGSAYEKGGWHYADPKRNSMPFSYEACKIEVGRHDSCILMGFALPEKAKALAVPMQQMIERMSL